MKKNVYPILGWAILSLVFWGFKFQSNKAFLPHNTEGVAQDSNYIKTIEIWHQQRVKDLKSENGWLNLAGLFWLEEGENTFGSDKTNKIIFPKGASFLGRLTLKNAEVFVKINLKSKVLVQNKAISEMKIFPTEKNIVLESSSLRWFIIKRGDKYGIRLRDLESPAVQEFTDIDTYPISTDWCIKAKLETATNDKKIAITDVLGQTNMQPSPGTLVF